MHCEKKRVCDGLELLIRGFGLCPLGCGVEIVHRAVNIIDVAVGEKAIALFHQLLDGGQVFWCELAPAVGLDFTIANIDHSDLVHFDTALTVFGIDPKHESAVVADAKVIWWKIGDHGQAVLLL